MPLLLKLARRALSRHTATTGLGNDTMAALFEKAETVGGADWDRHGMLTYDGISCKSGLLWDENKKEFVGLSC